MTEESEVQVEVTTLIHEINLNHHREIQHLMINYDLDF